MREVERTTVKVIKVKAVTTTTMTYSWTPLEKSSH
jgi:hypothetical protein